MNALQIGLGLLTLAVVLFVVQHLRSRSPDVLSAQWLSKQGPADPR